MAGMVNASPPADDRVDSWCWRRLAAIRAGLRHLALFPADHHSLDHNWNPEIDPGAPASIGFVARAASSLLRCPHDYGRCVHNRAAGQQFHLALPACDYRGEYPVLASGNVHHRTFLSFFACVDSGACTCWKAAQNFLLATDD